MTESVATIKKFMILPYNHFSLQDNKIPLSENQAKDFLSEVFNELIEKQPREIMCQKIVNHISHQRPFTIGVALVKQGRRTLLAPSFNGITETPSQCYFNGLIQSHNLAVTMKK